MNYFNKERKASLFPEIKDWTEDYNELRYAKDVNKLSHKEWFWFHTSAYKLIYFGSSIIPPIMFISLGLFFYLKHLPFGTFVMGIFTLYYIVNLVGKVKGRRFVKDTNFYDIFLREGFK